MASLLFSAFFLSILFFSVFYFAFVLGQKRWETHLRMWQKISVNKLRENEADFNQFRAFSQFSDEASPEGILGSLYDDSDSRRRSTETQLKSFWELPIENIVWIVFGFLLYSTHAAKVVTDCQPQRNSYMLLSNSLLPFVIVVVVCFVWHQLCPSVCLSNSLTWLLLSDSIYRCLSSLNGL